MFVEENKPQNNIENEVSSSGEEEDLKKKLIPIMMITYIKRTKKIMSFKMAIY